jgi:segregation and condensation protein A
MEPPMNFRVQLDMFLGPLDLLFYLVRKHELEVVELPIARITEQYVESLNIVGQIDVNAVGEFLEVASTLIELKSRSVLPGEEEIDEPLNDPRQDVVRRLLEFKQYRDAASILEERGRAWRERYPRRANSQPSRARRLDEQPIQEVELWDLVSAFGRVLKSKAGTSGPENIRYDDTPIHVYMQRISDRLVREGELAFTDLFADDCQRPVLVGTFLAVLELVRHHHAQATQPELFGEIWIALGEEPLPAELGVVDEYEHGGDRRAAA